MQVKIIDTEHENELERIINAFIKDKKIVDIKYQTSHFLDSTSQIYSFSAMIMYENIERR